MQSENSRYVATVTLMQRFKNNEVEEGSILFRNKINNDLIKLGLKPIYKEGKDEVDGGSRDWCS